MAVRVLITDGESEMRDTVRHLLECIGCKVVAEVATAAQALPLFRTVRPEIVILGAYGSQSNPLDLLRLIKREEPETSVVIVAGELAEEDAQIFRRAGALECFVEPLKFASLWRAISMAHPELMDGAFHSVMLAAAARKASRVSP